MKPTVGHAIRELGFYLLALVVILACMWAGPWGQ